MAITRQQIELESCWNPLKMGNVLQFRILKNFMFWMSGFSSCLHDESMFMHILFTFGWRHHPLGADLKSRLRGSKFYLILDYIIFRGFDTFIAFLAPKLWPKYRRLIREIPAKPLGNSRNIWIFWHNFWIRNARKSIKGFKDTYYSLISKKTLSHEIGSLVWRWHYTIKLQKMP